MTKKSERKGHLTSTSDVLQILLQNGKSALGQSFTKWKIWHQWEKIVGPEIASGSEPVHYAKGDLFVWVKSSAQMQEMSFLARQIKDNVNNYIGYRWVRRLRLTLNRNSIPQKHELDDSLKKLTKD